jgi:hypothetical protein
VGVTKSFTKTEDGTAITVHFLRPYPKIENTFIFPDVSDISGVEISQITQKLQKPIQLRRGGYQSTRRPLILAVIVR